SRRIAGPRIHGFAWPCCAIRTFPPRRRYACSDCSTASSSASWPAILRYRRRFKSRSRDVFALPREGGRRSGASARLACVVAGGGRDVDLVLACALVFAHRLGDAVLVERLHLFLEPAQHLADAFAELRQLRWAEQQQDHDDDDQDLWQAQPNRKQRERHAGKVVVFFWLC